MLMSASCSSLVGASRLSGAHLDPARVAHELVGLLGQLADVSKHEIYVIKSWTPNEQDPYHCAGIAVDFRFVDCQLPIGVQLELLSSYREIGGLGLVQRELGALFEWHVDLRTGRRRQYWTKMRGQVNNRLGALTPHAWDFI